MGTCDRYMQICESALVEHVVYWRHRTRLRGIFSYCAATSEDSSLLGQAALHLTGGSVRRYELQKVVVKRCTKYCPLDTVSLLQQQHEMLSQTHLLILGNFFS